MNVGGRSPRACGLDYGPKRVGVDSKLPVGVGDRNILNYKHLISQSAIPTEYPIGDDEESSECGRCGYEGVFIEFSF